MKKRNILWGVVSCLMALSLVLAACTPKSTPTTTGVLEIRATDAPPKGVSKIMVTTRNIQIHKAGASENSWITVVSQEKTFDLVAIQGAEVFLGSANVGSGNYTQIRLDVTKVIVTLDGKNITAKLPSDKLKVVEPWGVKAGQKTILTLDFDADKFVVITGNDQALVKPVIKLDVSQGERPLKKLTLTPDTTPPTVFLTTNANGATDVPINTKVGAFFNEAMDPLTLTTTTFTLKQGTTPVTGVVTYAGRAAIFTPAANLAANTEYTATITTGAKDLAGNALASNYTWRFTTYGGGEGGGGGGGGGGGTSVDTTAPTVSFIFPANVVTDVPINTQVGAFFSEVMNPLTLNTTTFTLKQGATPVTGTVNYVGVAATFNPAVNLVANTEYTATITTGAEDLAGNALASNYTWRFTTYGGGGGGGGGGGTPADTTAPTVSSTTNANGATDVPINTKVGAFFSEVMDPLTLTTDTFTLKQGTTPVTGTVNYIGVAATFNPAVNLVANTEYTATITTGAEDLAGNALASPYIWRWTTAAGPDTNAPTVSSTYPDNLATNVLFNSTVYVFFSEAMDPLTLTTATFTLKQGTTPVSGTVTHTGVSARFAGFLEGNTTYTATISTGAKDLAGNPLSSPYIWSFTTGAAQDATAPTVSSTIPANTATGVAINSAMTATFSEVMDPLTLTTATFTLKQGATPVTGTVTYAGVTTTFKPAANLAASTNYTATITTGAKDLAGNPLSSPYIWSFTTGAALDTTAPTVSSTIPANAATGVAINSAISAIFSEALNPLTVTTVTFTLNLTQEVTPVTGTVTYAGVTATFTPAANLVASTNYTATITTGAKDLAGNPLASNKVWSFTTAATADTTAPTVSSTIPANAATGVAINSAMTATFSEAMNPSTVTTATFTLKQGATPVTGTVTYAGLTATFTPAVSLVASTNYTATITTGAKDLAGNALASPYIWSFTTGAAPQAAVNLGAAGNFVILAKAGITTTGTTSITGDIGVSPAAATTMTGFGLVADPSNQWSTSSLVNGKVYAANYAVPTPANMTAAISAMETAYTNAAGRTLPAATELGAGNIGGLTLAPGLYKWSTGVSIPTDVTLSGSATDVWIFQIAQTLTVSSGVHVNLSGGALAKNVFWQVFGDTTLGTTSVFNGNILCQTQIIMQNGATLNGRALAQTQVTLIANTIVKPAP